MLATRMFFWWETVFVDPLTPVQRVPATERLFAVPARPRVYVAEATARTFETTAESR